MDLIVRSRLDRAQRKSVDRKVLAGKLHPVLPGIYSASPEHDWNTRLHAAQLARPDAVITSVAAARALFWPDLAEERITLAPARFRSTPPWLTTSQAPVPEAFIVRARGIRFAAAPLAVLQMTVSDGSIRPLTEALRRGAVTPWGLQRVMQETPAFRGKQALHRLVRHAQDNPWSPLETEAHQRLRTAGIDGWISNCRVRVRQKVYYLDIAFPELKIAIEIDGFGSHHTLADLTRDHSRQNDLVLAGWLVLRLTEPMLDALVPLTRRALKQRA